MKTLFGPLALALIPIVSMARGQFVFNNFGPGVNAPVTDWDGTNRLFGPGFVADLYYSPDIVTNATLLLPLGQPASFLYPTIPPGYFVGALREIIGLPGGWTITAQVRVWDLPDGDTWEECSTNWRSSTARTGESDLFQVTLDTPPGTPPYMTGLKSFSMHPVATNLSTVIPQLRSSTTTNAILFSWPAYYEAWAYSLQQNPDLNATNWVTLTNHPLLFGATNEIQYQVLIPFPIGTMFYRLAK